MSRGIVKIFRDGNCLAVKPLYADLVAVLEAELHYIKKTLLRGWEAKQFGSSIRTEEVDLFYYSQQRLITAGGFLPRLWKIIKRLGYTPELKDINPHPNPEVYSPDWDAVHSMLRVADRTFRHKQDDILKTICKYRNGTFDCPTGYGKSASLAMICALWPDAAIDITVDSAAIIRDIHNGLLSYGIDAGLVGAGRKDRRRRVQCYCARSLHLSPADADVLLGDEIHKLATPFYLEHLARYQRARMYGFSASQNMRFDGADKELEGIFGPCRLTISYQAAQAHNIVVPITVKWVPVQMDRNPGQGLDETQRARASIWRNPERNRIIANEARSFDAETQVLIIVDKVEHGMALQQLLPEFEFCYAPQDSGNVSRLRKLGVIPPEFKSITNEQCVQLRQEFSSGVLRKAIATGVWNQGVDFTQLEVLIRADAGASAIGDTQIPGRVARVHADKDHGLLIDFFDDFDPRYRSRSLSRRRNYAKKGWEQTSFFPEESRSGV